MKKQILAIDDDRSMQSLLKNMSSKKYDVSCALTEMKACSWLSSDKNIQFSQTHPAMNNYYRAKSSLLLIWVLIGSNVFAQQAIVKIKDGAGSHPVDETLRAAVAERPRAEVASLITEYIPNPTPGPVMKPQNLGNTPLFFSVVQKGTKKTLSGTVKIMDSESHQLVGGARSNSYYTMRHPKSKSGDITLLASVFGFADTMIHINYYDTERDTLQQNVTLFGNFFTVTFEMERINPGAGARATLYGVYFLKDAAIMTPGSKGPLSCVLDMLKGNPRMKIRLEGHTNSDEQGDIITVGPSKSYFAWKGDQQTRKGSPKELSEARAEVIRSWLVDQGIEAARIETFGWGGDKPLMSRNARMELVVLR